MKEKLANLIDVKSIMTISLSAVFSYLAIIGKITSEQFMTVFAMIITFYFAKNSNTTPPNGEKSDVKEEV